MGKAACSGSHCIDAQSVVLRGVKMRPVFGVEAGLRGVAVGAARALMRTVLIAVRGAIDKSADCCGRC